MLDNFSGADPQEGIVHMDGFLFSDEVRLQI